MDEFINEMLKKHSTSYVIRTYNNGEINEYVYGYSSVIPKKIKNTSDTLYDIASLTKMFTSYMIYIAYEEGKLDINDYVNDIDNKFVNLRDVKIIDLLSHNIELWTNGYLGACKNKDEFLNLLYNIEIKNREACYVDSHYMVLSRMLEDIYNMDYYDLIKLKILDRLDIKNTSYDPVGNIASSNYEYKDDKVIDDIEVGMIHDAKARVAKNLGIHTGHAGIFTSASEYMKLLLSLIEDDKKILKDSTIKMMISHRDVNKENLNNMLKYCKLSNQNDMYKECVKNNYDVHISRCINNMGARYKCMIDSKNDVPKLASENTICFSGYAGPCFLLDFDRHICILVMSNVIHTSHLDRVKRKALSDEIIEYMYNKIIKED